ncbi:unnamed protein product [Lactuca virosa]|uniref:Lumazine-binding domain-containing protein n=1 Tax=Lactuca virosa TaxID=75947 RepID=A0AAU9M0J2_9ASTR|nr:unnamed protein product [Lactuca virosa]
MWMEQGEIVSMEVEGDSLWIKVKISPKILNFIVAKGFIAVDGTSLTVVDVFDEEECFNFLLVEYTQQKVVIPLKKIGQKSPHLQRSSVKSLSLTLCRFSLRRFCDIDSHQGLFVYIDELLIV